MKKTLGMTIAERRKALGLTQLELAERVGVTDKAVSKWERELSCPDIGTLPALAEVFGVSVDELMQGRPDAGTSGKQTKEILSTVLDAVALAMGVAVTALAAMGRLESGAAVTMLGIGLACTALSRMREKD